MADNIIVSAGTADGPTVAFDEITGIAHQRVKVQHGADGSATDVSSASPMPVTASQATAASLNCTEASAAASLALLTTMDADTGLIVVYNAIIAGTVKAEGGVAPTTVLSVGGRYDATPRAVDDGDAVTLAATAAGRLLVDIADGGNTITVDGTVTANLSATDNAVLDAIAASTAIIDDWDETNRAAVNLIAGQAGIAAGAGAVGVTVPRVTLASDDPAVALLGTIDADTGTLAVTGGGLEATALRVTIASDSTGVLSIDDAGGSLTVDGTVTANLSATDNAVLDSIVTNTTGLAGTVSGTELQVDVVAALPAGTNAIGKLAANSGVDIGDVDVTSLPASTNTLEVVGDVAHDAAAAGNPVLMGARGTNNLEGITQTDAGDASYVMTDLNGCLVTRTGTTLEELISTSQSDTGGTEVAMSNFTAVNAAIHNYITSVTVYNSHASTNGSVTLLNGSAGTTLWVFPAPATGGATHNFDPPLKMEANKQLYFDVSEAISTIYVSVNGFQAQG